MDTDLETRLRSGLADEAAGITGAPPGLFADVVAGARRQRRNRLAALGAAACAVVAAVTVPLLGTAGPASTPATGTTASPTAPATYAPYPYPPRGSLAGDAGYVQGLLDRPWHPSDQNGDELPVPSDRQVVFAGAVPGGVQAFVIGWEDAGWYGWWLHGPAGAAPADLQPDDEPNPVDPTLPMTSSWSTDGVGALVVVARPGDTVELSGGQTIEADGTITRRPFQPVGDAAGIAVVPITGAMDLTSAVRVTRDGQPVEVGGPGSGSEGGSTYDPAAALAGAAGTPDAGLVRTSVDGLLPELGLTAGQVQVQVLWGGPIPTERVPDAEAVVLTVRLPSGAAVLLGAYGSHRAAADQGGGLQDSGPCAKAVLPAGSDVAATGVAMRCDVRSTEDGSVLGSRLVVLPPAGAARIRVESRATDGSTVSAYYPGTDAATISGVPDGLGTIAALDAADQVTGEVPLRGIGKVRLDG